jgi:glutaredoxin 2
MGEAVDKHHLLLESGYGNSLSLHLNVQSMCRTMGKLLEIASGINDNIALDDILI